ncbi:hypothetical protein X925_01960 [Petrotoga sp. 9T1HF07.CasAA.8.2]|nr:hypothetical protein X925_01960 [Petrotoga sp. 9T1HF07.CasAA.8.2]PNR91912.1 hypothetical protein X926_07475 [Petrotoga sp. HWHPT.55.6.3]
MKISFFHPDGWGAGRRGAKQVKDRRNGKKEEILNVDA